MIHPGQGVWEYQGAMVLGMRLKKENRIRKSTIPLPHRVPRVCKALNLVLQDADRGKPPAINHKKNSIDAE